jgi:hypothetical protein
MKTIIYFLIFLCAFNLESQTLSLRNVPNNIRGTYDSTAGFTSANTFDVRHKGAACSYYITFSAGGAGSYTNRQLKNGTVPLDYQIYDNMTNRNILKDIPGATFIYEVISSTVPQSNQNATYPHSFTFYALPGQAPTAGSYTDSFNVSLYLGTFPSGTLIDGPMSVGATMTMGSAVAVSIVAPGASFDNFNTSYPMNLNDLTVPKTVYADLMVRSNAIHSVTLTSTNGGILKGPDPAETIPYVFKINNITRTLLPATPFTLVSGVAPTLVTGDRYPMSVTIGTVSYLAEGTYTDTITFIVSAP